jgi:hydroxymethylbilane synthase
MTNSKQSVIIGSRGSDLALWQAHHVRDLLTAAHPNLHIEIRIISTMGDRVLDSSLALIGGKGVFTKEIENALLDNSIDLAVHSLKDLPTDVDERLTVAAIPQRANVEDVFLSRDKHATLATLPAGAVIATGSLRRRSQLLHYRNDLQTVDIRGNVPTRIQKLLDSNWDGMILARAGVERLGLMEHVVQTISTELILPAVGQGALGIETRANDSRMIELLLSLNDNETKTAVTAERAFLRALGGGCQVPIGAHAKIVDDALELSGCIVHPNGDSILRGIKTGNAADADLIGADLAATLLKDGGRDILDLVERLQTEADTTITTITKH